MREQRPGQRTRWRWAVYACLVATIVALPALTLAARGADAIHAVIRGAPEGASGETSPAEAGPVCDRSVCIRPAGGSANLGVYDPDGWFKDSPSVAIEHMYMHWTGYDPIELAQSLEETASRNRWPLITVEPWPEPLDREASLLPDIVDGFYDTAIAELCSAFGVFDRPVFLRWGHEMELESGRYSWSNRDPAAYIEAYRHFVDRCRADASQVFYVWSPAGNEGAHRYWPGPEYADYVGLSVFGFADWEVGNYGRARGFEENMAEKYWRVAFLEHPIMISELGVADDRANQTKWIHDAQASLARYPLIRTVVYFNAVDKESVWGAGYRVPDWRIDPRVFD